MGSCGGGGVRPTQKMLLSASLLLLGFSSSALAGGHGNSMGCCNEKLVSGSGPKSGIYYLDTEASVDTFPDVCMDECVYVKESGSGRFCFKPSSMYASECMGDSEDHETGNMITIDSDGHESMGGHGDAKCDFSNIENVDDQFYKLAGIRTDEEGILKFVFVDPSASVKLSLEGQDFEFDACVDGVCPTKNPVPAGIYTVEVQYMFREEDGTIPQQFEDGKWTSPPLIKTYHVDDKNYCEDANCDFSNIENVDAQFYKLAGIRTDEEGILKFVFVDPSASVKLSLEGQDFEFDAC